MTRWIPILLLASTAWLLSACGDAEPTSSQTNAPQYMVTLPAFESIVQPVVEGRATTTAILSPGDSPHTFDPRPSTVRAAGQSSALLYGAADLDEWAAQLDAPRHVALIDLLPESYRHTFPVDPIHMDERTVAEDEHDHRPGDVDPHFWLDPLAVEALLPALTDTLCSVDAEGCDTYRANASTFADSLQALHQEIDTLLAPVRSRAFLTSQPFLHYFATRYNLELAAVVERSPAHEPSARRIHALIEHARDAEAHAMITQLQLPATSSRSVIEGARLKTAGLDPVGGNDERLTYAALMRYNAYTLRDVLAE
ncbi:MAG: metal ABC transporter substrate-binding protein [Longimonas sp.]|uniref:metal ABC transporter substrate-binding protein n=1 Tax=Longimonas sp. TaxID=2039626 RepID=UPI00335F8260